MKRPILLDTTLRDGEQSPGIYFTHEQKIMLARGLDELGVEVIEAGIPGMGKEEKKVLRALARLGLKAEILAWNRLCDDDIRSSLESGVSCVHVSVPTSFQQLTRKLNKDTDWVFRQMDSVIGFAVREGLTVSLGAEDASRSDLGFVIRVFRHAEELGVTRVRYADTLGLLTPGKALRAIEAITGKLRVPLDFHAHNDFGLALANSLMAWEGGAQVISCSLLGMGERAGNTALEEFAGAAHFLWGHFPDFDFVRLRGLCSTLAEISSRPMPAHKPLFGSDIFKHESGIHVDGLIKDSENYEFFPPEATGGKRELVVGKHSGSASLKHLVGLRGKELSDSSAQEFLMRLRERMAGERDVNAEKLFESFLVGTASVCDSGSEGVRA